MTRKIWFVSPLLLICLSYGAHAAVVNAASCSSSDVQAAVSSAAAGDTVVIPSGNCTWTFPVTIAGKGIIVQGQTTCSGTPVSSCVDNTNIADDTSGDNPAFNITGLDATHFVQLTGVTITTQAAIADGVIQIYGAGSSNFTNSVSFRVDHVHLKHPTTSGRGISVFGVYGLIDHFLVDVTDVSGSDQSISIYGSSIGNDGGFTPWMNPLSLGTDNAVYVEDSTFNYNNQNEDAVDAYTGGRVVIRYNAFNNISQGFHGTDSGDNRSVFSYEIYNNIYTNNSSNTIRAATLRGGTGVIYNNTYGGSHGQWYDVTPMLYRACPPMDQSQWQTCGGTNWEIGSTDFSSQASRTGSTNGGVKFCAINRDTVCTTDATCSAITQGDTCSTYFDGAAGGGYSCRDQVGRTHNQARSPLYAWNNGSIGITPYNGGYSCGIGLDKYLGPGVDYINGSSMPGYTAYTYPDPLQNSTSVPNPPTGLTAVVQ
ncbi:MAG TPA: hypothetical protein VK788_19000 [Terriglobales bacterium]|nr:hypothetical protein [Terriglobales bacterium]